MRAWGHSPAEESKRKRLAASRSHSSGSNCVRSKASKSRDEDEKLGTPDSAKKANRKHRSNSRWRRGQASTPVEESNVASKKENVDESLAAEDQTNAQPVVGKSSDGASSRESGSEKELESEGGKVNTDASLAKKSIADTAESPAKKSRKKEIVSNKKGSKGEDGFSKPNDDAGMEMESGKTSGPGADTTEAPSDIVDQEQRTTAPKALLLGRTAMKLTRIFRGARPKAAPKHSSAVEVLQKTDSEAKVGTSDKVIKKAGLQKVKRKGNKKRMKRSESGVGSSESSESSKQKRKKKKKKKKRAKDKKAKKKREKNGVRKLRSEPQVVTQMSTFVAVPGNLGHPGMLTVRPLPTSVSMVPLQGRAAAFPKFGIQPQKIAASMPDQTAMSASELRALIKGIYERHNPAKLVEFGTLMQKYEGFEMDVYLYVCKKYGEQPEVGATELSRASTGQGTSIGLKSPKQKPKLIAVAKKASALAPMKPRAKASSEANARVVPHSSDIFEDDDSGWPFVGEEYSDGGSSSSSVASKFRPLSSQSSMPREAIEELRLPSGARVPLCKGHLMRGIGQGWPSASQAHTTYARDAKVQSGLARSSCHSPADASTTLAAFLATCQSSPASSSTCPVPRTENIFAIDPNNGSKDEVLNAESLAKPLEVALEQSLPRGTLPDSEDHEPKDHVRDLPAPSRQEASKSVENAAANISISAGGKGQEEADLALAEPPPEDDVIQQDGSTTEESRSPSPGRRSAADQLGDIAREEAERSIGESLKCKVSAEPTSEVAAINQIAEVVIGASDSMASNISAEPSAEKMTMHTTADVLAGVHIVRTPESCNPLDSVSVENAEQPAGNLLLEAAPISTPLQAPVIGSTKTSGEEKAVSETVTTSAIDEQPSPLSVQTPHATAQLTTTAPATVLVNDVPQESSEKVLTKSLLDALDAAERADPQFRPVTPPVLSGTKPAPTPAQQAALSNLMRLTSLGKSQTGSGQSSVHSSAPPLSAASVGQGPQIPLVVASTHLPQAFAPSLGAARLAELPIPPPPPGAPPPDVPQVPLASFSWPGVPVHWSHLPLSPAQLIPTAIPPRPPH